ncbi:hypothetical protein [uncultured Polaribacter sp.]|uniref:hypothetical protein n=1 Tax=uncultured Polaribacter sp. TaxID=174711 RepID=UPI00261B3A7A|nr:hypothetical protein [uncultured Polaribacter sp.]
MTRDFIPRTEGQLIIWLTNFKDKIATLGADLGLSPEALTAITADCEALIATITAVETARTDLATAVTAKDNTKKSTISTLRTEIARIKTNPNYTEAIGKDLSIVGETTPQDLNNAKPTLSAEAFPGYVRIKFIKGGFSGVNIYSRIKGSVGWSFLSRDTSSPYEDQRPLENPNVPETREYMAIGLKGDDEIGQESDVVVVVFWG